MQMRFKQEPNLVIPHKGLEKVFKHLVKVSPCLGKDRYTVPEYNKIHDFIMSGDMQEMILSC